MTSSSQKYDILSSSNNHLNETELVEVNQSNLTGKNSEYSNLNSIEKETEFEENKDINEDFKDLKEQFNNSAIINSPLVKKDSGKIKFRKGNLHIYFYDKNGIPLIVIGPDCKQ